MNTNNIVVYDNLSSVSNKKYDVTTIFLTYNPDLNDTLISLKSLIKQKGLKHQIVVCDDGSKKDLQQEIKNYFEKNNYQDYKLVKNIKNVGTVKNVKTGLDNADGEYIKLLSPADCLIGQDSLAIWLKKLKESNREWSFCMPVFYYRDENDNPKALFSHSMPIITSIYNRKNINKCIYEYIVKHDVVNGASTLCKKETMGKYISCIVDKIIYCEDLMYKLMIFDSKLPLCYKHNLIAYESKCGNSHNNKTFSVKINDDSKKIKELLYCINKEKDILDKKSFRDYFEKNIDKKTFNRFTLRWDYFKRMLINLSCVNFTPYKLNTKIMNTLKYENFNSNLKIYYKNISLKPISEFDLEFLRTWRNDRQLCKYLRDIGYISKQDQYNWYLKQKEDKDAITLAIHETKELNRLVGSISLYDIKPNDTAEIGRILIGDPEAHHKGIGRNAMKALIDYGFKTYNLKQITLVVHQDNKPAYSIYKSLGFTKIGERKSHIDGYEDIMINKKEKN